MWIKRDALTTVRDCRLRNLGLKNVNEINNWFRCSYNNEYYIPGLSEAVEILKNLLQLDKETPIHIIGDYDVDGITATSICYSGLIYAGFKNVTYRIPKRFSEGYGLNTTIIDEIDSGVILTVDNGIAAKTAIEKAKEKGLFVILTDHHLPPKDADGNMILPPADIIIDPHVTTDATFTGYCGAGIAYRLMKELLPNKCKFAYRLQALAAIGTIADCMDLREENYVIVRNGLRLLPIVAGTGLRALMQAWNLEKISSEDIGFKIGPCLNAPGRLYDDGALTSLALLLWDGNIQDAVRLAENIVEENQKRKDSVASAMEKANAYIQDECLYGDLVYSIYLPDINEGILGIIAGRIAEQEKVPAFVFTDKGTSFKGSGRTYGDIHLKNLLDNVNAVDPDIFIGYGGHDGAAGLSIKKEKFQDFRLEMNAKCPTTALPTNDNFFDLEIKELDIPRITAEEDAFNPSGKANEALIYKIKNYRGLPYMGKIVNKLGENGGFKIIGQNSTVVGFNNPELLSCSESSEFEIYGTISYNYFKGKAIPQITAVDIVPLRKKETSTDFANLIAKMASKR